MKQTSQSVETHALWKRLADLGCHEFQGYVIARPMPADKVADLTRNRPL